MKIIVFILVLSTICTFVSCNFDIEFVNSTRNIMNKRAVAGEYPIFKVASCPPTSTIISKKLNVAGPTVGKYSAGCVESLLNSDLTVKGVCYPNPSSDLQLGVQSYTLTINYILDKNGVLYFGPFYIKDYAYGSIIVIVDRTDTVGGNTNIFYNTYQCGTDYCDSSKFYTGCTTQRSIMDLSGSGSDPIIVTSDPTTVDFCKSGASCCTFPPTCSSMTYTINYPNNGGNGGINAVGDGPFAVAVAQPFTLPLGASSLVSVGFIVNTNSGNRDYDILIVVWDTTHSKPASSTPVYSTSGTANTISYSLVSVTIPPLVLNPSLTYAAIFSACNKAHPSDILIGASASGYTGYYVSNDLYSHSWYNWNNVAFQANFQ